MGHRRLGVLASWCLCFWAFVCSWFVDVLIAWLVGSFDLGIVCMLLNILASWCLGDFVCWFRCSMFSRILGVLPAWFLCCSGEWLSIAFCFFVPGRFAPAQWFLVPVITLCSGLLISWCLRCWRSWFICFMLSLFVGVSVSWCLGVLDS